MEIRELLNLLTLAERLKDTTRHSYTSMGRHESVAEHSWMATLMAFFMRDEFPEVDMDKVLRMCVIHDLGECFTGDIPAFEKKQSDRDAEKKLLFDWVATLPERYSSELRELYDEMEAKSTPEAKVYKAIDNLEALVQHNLADISTWLPIEYTANLVYGDENVAFSQYMTELKQAIREESEKKIADASREGDKK